MIARKIFLCFLTVLTVFAVTGCVQPHPDYWNASAYGVLPENSGLENSRSLQALIDMLAQTGGTVYIPAGIYLFAENGTQTIGSHCIKMRSNVSIIGAGEGTVLMPVGNSQYGLDMFYFNDYLDTGQAIYLENCRFERFVIDASQTACETYTSAGKGFMFNLFRNCHWNEVTVRNTDATGFGVDCPIDSSISNCRAIGCGKAATTENGGASGFGIGFGFCAEEGITIRNCYAAENKKFGFFFEHQGRFDPDMYGADRVSGFLVQACTAVSNLYNFGGIVAYGGTYTRCTSMNARQAAFFFSDCTDFEVHACTMQGSTSADVSMEGTPGVFRFTDNQSDQNRICLDALAEGSINLGNSWN